MAVLSDNLVYCLRRKKHLLWFLFSRRRFGFCICNYADNRELAAKDRFGELLSRKINGASTVVCIVADIVIEINRVQESYQFLC